MGKFVLGWGQVQSFYIYGGQMAVKYGVTLAWNMGSFDLNWRLVLL